MFAPIRVNIYLLIILLFLSPLLSSTSSLRWDPRQHRALSQRDTSSKNDTQTANRMRILALFSSTSNDLGVDHHIGRQVLKLALERAKRLRPEVGQIELIIHNEIADCRELSALPNYVAEQFYSAGQVTNQCDAGEPQEANADAAEVSPFKHIGQTTTVQPSGGDQLDQDRCRSVGINRELDEYFGEEQHTRSDSKEGLVKADDLRESASTSRIDAIIGPSCDPLVDIVARMAAYWRTPIYTVTSINAQFGRKDIFSTLTRLSPSIEHLSMFIVRIMKHFKWKHMAILVDRKRLENEFLLDNLERTIDHNQHQMPIERSVLEIDRAGLLSTKKLAVNDETMGRNITFKSSLCNEEMRSKLVSASLVARVVLLLLDDIKSVRTVLLCAHELEMNNGEYTFIAPNLALESSSARDVSQGSGEDDAGGSSQTSKSTTGGSTLDWFVAEDEANNVKARQMFESLMVLTVEQPVGEEYNAFVEQTLDLANQAYPSIRFDRSSLGPVAVALHDSLLLAVEAHWRRTSRGDKGLNGAQVNSGSVGAAVEPELSSQLDTGEADQYEKAALMWNTTYSGGLMTGLHINSNGDQELDYILSDLEPEMGSMRPVATYSKQTRQVQMLANSYIHWPSRIVSGSSELIDSDEAPPDEPECGFDGMAERCIDRQNLYAVLTVMLILVLLITTASGISVHRYKRIKYQMKLDDYWWRIQWDELKFLEMVGSVSAVRSACSGDDESGLLGAKSRVGRRAAVPSLTKSDRSGEQSRAPTVTGRSMVGSKFAASSGLRSGHDDKLSVIKSEFSVVVRRSRLARYKGDYVIVKQLNANTIDITRDLLVELKSMRELCQENLSRFVGLCIEPGRLSIVGEYCSRGSLKDLLSTEDVAMDLTLKYSILGDIINGLNFIHTSLLNFHGRLKSTNLVLDSRFTVKLTDFGLRSLYSQLDAVEDQLDDSNNFGNTNNDDNQSGRTMVDTRSLSQRRPSLTQTIYQMDSVSMRGEQTLPGQAGDGTNDSNEMQMRHKNRGPIRYFWTAPEHLRDKCPHFAGSKRGDIYSLAIIMFELFTRKEPYYYGTNASPNWAAIKRLKHADQRPSTAHTKLSDRLKTARLSIASAASSQLSVRRKSRLSTAGTGVGGLGSMIGRQTDRARDRMRRSQASVGPTHKEEEEEEPATAAVDNSPAMANPTAVLQTSMAQPVEQPSISVSSVDNEPFGEESRRAEGGSLAGASTHDGASRKGSNTASAVSAGSKQVSTVSKLGDNKAASSSLGGRKGSAAESITVTAAMANEILDQLRMGVQPEPVRPYLPNFILHDIDANLIELMRDCWQEAPAMRPSVERIRNKIKKITAGVASKNYLDNLLERLQTYASQLERIVDEKSADIIAEKARTEELLYQLVPRFVADKLKHHEPIIPQLFDGVTVFFSDIVGFEKYAAVMSPIELVDLLNNIYSSFESIINSFDVIKIEVILDQFLVAAGIMLQDGGVSGAAVEQQQSLPGESAMNQELEQIQEDENGAKAGKSGGGKGAVKSTRKLLTAIRLSHSQDNNGAAEVGNDKSSKQDQQQQQPVKDNNGQQQPASNDRQISVVHSSDSYKRNCAEQVARMALCIRDLVKSFHFRQSLSRSTSAQVSEVGGSSNEGASGAKQKPLASDCGTGEAAQVNESKPKLDNIVAATFNIRIGIHSGKVCAGIVGLKRPKFCLIGDTVNVASRMHTNSKANKIQVSADTANLLRGVPGLFTQARGKIEVKGKGQMETYWLETSH